MYKLSVLLVFITPLAAADWPMWGGTPSRNMVAEAKGLPVEIDPGDLDPNTEQPILDKAKNILWAAKLGSQSYGNPVVAGGKVFVGTNNESPRDPTQTGDRGVLMVFDEKTGKFLWQLIVPKLGAGKVSDWEFVGLCSAPCVIGDRAWLVTNRGEVVCLDTKGLADGNAGPFQDEAKFMSADGRPVALGDQHADIIWVFDVRKELGVFPHNVSSCSPLVIDGLVYTATSNGVDWSHTNVPAPLAPSLVALDADKGTLVGEEISGIAGRVLHASWSSPAHAKVRERDMVVWGAGDGFAYGFDPKPVMDEKEGIAVLKELWRYDCNPPDYRQKDGKPIKYATYPGPSEVISTAVVQGNFAYLSIGQDPEHGDGVGCLSCIDLTGSGDFSGKAVWTFRDIGRSISTPAVSGGLVFQAEYDGDLHCLDAKTGKQHWVHETDSRIWGSPMVADGKVLLPTEDGILHILEAGKDKKALGTAEFDAPIYSSPVVANDVLFVATMTHLYAIGNKGAAKAP